MGQQPGYLTVEEAADRVGVSVATMRRYCVTGQVPAVRVGRQWLVMAEGLALPERSRRGRPRRGTNFDLITARRHVFSKDLRETWFPDVLRFQDVESDDQVLGAVSSRLDGAGPFDPPQIIDVSKTEYLTRNATLLSLEDRIAYHAVVATFADRVEDQVAQVENVAGRLTIYSARRSDDPHYFLRQSRDLWLSFRDAIAVQIDEGYEWMMKTDLVGYFDNIQHRLLVSEIQALNADPRALQALSAMLREWMPPGGFGIPQGPDASRLLGNLYMIPVDQVMVRGSWSYLRYMDDIRIFGRSRSELVQAARTFEAECRKRGLGLASHKTNVLRGEAAKSDMDDPEVQQAHYLFDQTQQWEEARPLLVRLLRSALREGGVEERRARFSLWRLAQLRDRQLVSQILRKLEILAPLASLAAAFLQPFLGRARVFRAVTEFLTDPERNTSLFLRCWLFAAMLDQRRELPLEWVSAARRVCQDRNLPVAYRCVAVGVLGRGKQVADLAWIRQEIAREYDPEMMRGYLVALARAGSLDRATVNMAITRFPEVRRTAEFLQGRTRVRSLIWPAEWAPLG